MNTTRAYAAYVEQLGSRVGRTAGPLAAPDQVGFTAPARIWAKIDDIERSAASLDRDVDANVREPSFLAGWKTWLQNWRLNYVIPYRSETVDSVRRRIGALSGSDELDAAVERERQRLHDFYENYSRQRLPNGAPVPFPSGLPPIRHGADPQASPPWTLPWWFWLVAGGAAAFIAWRFYVTYKMVGARGKAIEDKLVPAVAERYGLPGQETREVLQAGRDGRDRASRSPGILDLAYYAQGHDRPLPPRPPRPPHFERSPFDMDEGDAEDADPNFAYDPSRDPLYDRFR